MERSDCKNSQAETIETILAVEWKMFSAVRSATPASCQSRPNDFKAIRGMVFSFWPEELLQAYLGDLQTAQHEGRNLLTEKYARMDKLIPSLPANPLVEEIVAAETRWQEEIWCLYPALAGQVCRATAAADDGSNFSVYLKSELETYSNATLVLYRQWVRETIQQGRNLSLMMLEKLAAESPFKSIDEAERYFSTPGSSIEVG